MPSFKVWNASRQVKKAVTASTLSELISKSSAKLECGVVRVVLEADGTEVDGDDELLAVHDSVLMALQQGEHWTPSTVSEPSLPVATDDVSVEAASPLPGQSLRSAVITFTQVMMHTQLLTAAEMNLKFITQLTLAAHLVRSVHSPLVQTKIRLSELQIHVIAVVVCMFTGSNNICVRSVTCSL